MHLPSPKGDSLEQTSLSARIPLGLVFWTVKGVRDSLENTLDETKDCSYLDISWTLLIVHRARSPLSRSLKARIELGSHFPYLETKRQGQIRDGEGVARLVPGHSEWQPPSSRRESSAQWATSAEGVGGASVARMPGTTIPV